MTEANTYQKSTLLHFPLSIEDQKLHWFEWGSDYNSQFSIPPRQLPSTIIPKRHCKDNNTSNVTANECKMHIHSGLRIKVCHGVLQSLQTL